MDAGWFATHSEYGPVFIKHFKKAETKNALRETAIFDRFDQELHSNLNSPLATEMYNGHVVLMQLRLGVMTLRDVWMVLCYRFVLCRAGICLITLGGPLKVEMATLQRRYVQQHAEFPTELVARVVVAHSEYRCTSTPSFAPPAKNLSRDSAQ